MNYLITPSAKILEEALDSWGWIGFDGKKPILVTAFGDVFFHANDEIWFLDTVEGSFKFVCQSREEMKAILSSLEGRDTYLYASLVDQAVDHGQPLRPTQCYDFKLPPALGGAMDYANIERADFMVVVNLRGQIHHQVHDVPAGTKITKLNLVPKQRSKPWWKFW